MVETPSIVGAILGLNGTSGTDEILLPNYLETENKKYIQFLGGYIWNSQQVRGWLWVDELDKSSWSEAQIGQVFKTLTIHRRNVEACSFMAW